ncbi:MAG: lysophospholipid acyltransferase family protein [Legionellales bacterium]|nr:lysophospholipid acyltransferase family protein [Legionellales bacterium]
MTYSIRTYLQTITPTLSGKIFYYLMPYRRKIIFANLRRVFSDELSEADIKKLAQCFYSHLARSVYENIKMRFQSLATIKTLARIEGLDHILNAAAEGKGLLILSGHFGNWELSPIAGILNFTQYQHRFHFIRKTLGAKWIEKILFRRYYQAGLNVIPKKNSLMQVCDALDREDAVVFILDQHASIKSKDGIMVEFFGEKAGTFRSLAMLAKHTQAPVVPALTYRDKHGQHVLEFLPKLIWQQAQTDTEEIYQNTLLYNQTLEKMILAHPEQWLWLHRRWKGDV